MHGHRARPSYPEMSWCEHSYCWLLTPVFCLQLTCFYLRFYRLPSPRIRRAFHGVQDSLVFYAIAEVRLGQTVLFERSQKVIDGMHKRMFVADDVSGRPPGAHVGVLGLRHHNRPIALLCVVLRAIEKFEFIHPLELEGQASPTAVHLKRVVVLAPAADPRRF